MNLQEMILFFDSLSDDEQDSLLEILCKHKAKARKTEILANFKELNQNYPLRGKPIIIKSDFDEPMPELWDALAECFY